MNTLNTSAQKSGGQTTLAGVVTLADDAGRAILVRHSIS